MLRTLSTRLVGAAQRTHFGMSLVIQAHTTDHQKRILSLMASHTDHCCFLRVHPLSLYSIAITATAPKFFHSTSSALQATPTTTTASPITSSPSSSASASTSSTDSPVSLLRNQLRYYAVAEIKNRPYLITKNDIIVLDRLNDVKLGDVIELNQIKELGSKDYAIQGQPYVSPEYFSIKATVIEQPKGKMIETFKKKRRKHFQRRYHFKPLHTLLRVSELEVKAQ